MPVDYEKDDFRYVDSETGERVSYLQTLKAMTEGGDLWHHHWEWDRIKAELPSMTEEQAEAKARAINRRAAERLATWQAYQ